MKLLRDNFNVLQFKYIATSCQQLEHRDASCTPISELASKTNGAVLGNAWTLLPYSKLSQPICQITIEQPASDSLLQLLPIKRLLQESRFCILVTPYRKGVAVPTELKELYQYSEKPSLLSANQLDAWLSGCRNDCARCLEHCPLCCSKAIGNRKQMLMEQEKVYGMMDKGRTPWNVFLPLWVKFCEVGCKSLRICAIVAQNKPNMKDIAMYPYGLPGYAGSLHLLLSYRATGLYERGFAIGAIDFRAGSCQAEPRTPKYLHIPEECNIQASIRDESLTEALSPQLDADQLFLKITGHNYRELTVGSTWLPGRVRFVVECAAKKYSRNTKFDAKWKFQISRKECVLPTCPPKSHEKILASSSTSAAVLAGTLLWTASTEIPTSDRSNSGGHGAQQSFSGCANLKAAMTSSSGDDDWCGEHCRKAGSQVAVQFTDGECHICHGAGIEGRDILILEPYDGVCKTSFMLRNEIIYHFLSDYYRWVPTAVGLGSAPALMLAAQLHQHYRPATPNGFTIAEISEFAPQSSVVILEHISEYALQSSVVILGHISEFAPQSSVVILEHISGFALQSSVVILGHISDFAPQSSVVILEHTSLDFQIVTLEQLDAACMKHMDMKFDAVLFKHLSPNSPINKLRNLNHRNPKGTPLSDTAQLNDAVLEHVITLLLCSEPICLITVEQPLVPMYPTPVSARTTDILKLAANGPDLRNLISSHQQNSGGQSVEQENSGGQSRQLPVRGAEQEFVDISCSVCDATSDSEHNPAQLCSKCPKGLHVRCLGALLTPSAENEDWYCKYCRQSGLKIVVQFTGRRRNTRNNTALAQEATILAVYENGTCKLEFKHLNETIDHFCLDHHRWAPASASLHTVAAAVSVTPAHSKYLATAPKGFESAIKSEFAPQWSGAMLEHMETLFGKGVFVFKPWHLLPANSLILPTIWVYYIKVEKFKARPCCLGNKTPDEGFCQTKSRRPFYLRMPHGIPMKQLDGSTGGASFDDAILVRLSETSTRLSAFSHLQTSECEWGRRNSTASCPVLCFDCYSQCDFRRQTRLVCHCVHMTSIQTLNVYTLRTTKIGL